MKGGVPPSFRPSPPQAGGRPAAAGGRLRGWGKKKAGGLRGAGPAAPLGRLTRAARRRPPGARLGSPVGGCPAAAGGRTASPRRSGRPPGTKAGRQDPPPGALSRAAPRVPLWASRLQKDARRVVSAPRGCRLPLSLPRKFALLFVVAATCEAALTGNSNRGLLNIIRY